MKVHRSNILKLALVYQNGAGLPHLMGETLASRWILGGEDIPTDFLKKIEYFINKLDMGKMRKPRMKMKRDMRMQSLKWLKKL